MSGLESESATGSHPRVALEDPPVRRRPWPQLTLPDLPDLPILMLLHRPWPRLALPVLDHP